MQTDLAPFVKDTPQGREAEAILRKCVHCGFCTATCPTYQLLGDELDGPRGRIYLIKEVLEGRPATATTQLHLDRCLTCRSCETTCPSGVEYGRLIDIGRPIVDAQVPRSPADRAARYALSKGLRNKPLFGTALLLGRISKMLLPKELARHVPDARAVGEWPTRRHERRMLIMEGCVQPVLAPGQVFLFAPVPHGMPLAHSPQSSAPPQPLPMRPQYWPPDAGLQLTGVQSALPHTLASPPPAQVFVPVHSPHSRTPPQPSPMVPQKLPPANAQPSGTQPASTHTPFRHSLPSVQAPQSSGRPQPSPTTPQ